MLTVTKKFEFDASHFLPDYEGKCSNLHGHRWFGEVEVIGPDKSTIASKETYTSMIIDFRKMNEILNNTIIRRLDHNHINNILEIPTCENIVMWIVGQLRLYFGQNLIRVKLHETPDSFAEWKVD